MVANTFDTMQKTYVVGVACVFQEHGFELATSERENWTAKGNHSLGSKGSIGTQTGLQFERLARDVFPIRTGSCFLCNLARTSTSRPKHVPMSNLGANASIK